MKLYNVVKRVTEFNSTMKLYLAGFLTITVIETLVGPYVAKAVGLYMAAVTISIYTIARSLSNLTLPYLEHLDLRKATGLLLVSQACYPLARIFLIITEDVEAYVYIVWGIALVHGAFMNIVSIKYDTYLATDHVKMDFSDIQVTESLAYTIVGLGAGVVTTLLYLYSDMAPIYVALVLDVFVLAFLYAAKRSVDTLVSTGVEIELKKSKS